MTQTSTSLIPNFLAALAAVSPARCAANGVLFRVPLKPTVPAEDQQSVSPPKSVIVTSVLLKVAFTWTIARATFRRVFRLPDFATAQ